MVLRAAHGARSSFRGVFLQWLAGPALSRFMRLILTAVPADGYLRAGVRLPTCGASWQEPAVVLAIASDSMNHGRRITSVPLPRLRAESVSIRTVASVQWVDLTIGSRAPSAIATQICWAASICGRHLEPAILLDYEGELRALMGMVSASFGKPSLRSARTPPESWGQEIVYVCDGRRHVPGQGWSRGASGHEGIQVLDAHER